MITGNAFLSAFKVLQKQYHPGHVDYLLNHISRLFLFFLIPPNPSKTQPAMPTMVPTREPNEIPTTSIAPQGNRRRLPWSVKYCVQVLFRLPYHLSAQLLAENVWTRPLYQSIPVVDQVLN